MDTPRPLILLAIQPRTWRDEERLRHGLRQMTVDDPTLSISRDEETHATVIGALGEVQLEVVIDRLAREFGVEARVGRPQVAYAEALTRPADGETKYVRQTGGTGSTPTSRSASFQASPARASSSKTRSPTARFRRSSSRRSKAASKKCWRAASSPGIQSTTCES